jgi:ribose transport system substrate-binding protein
MIINNLKQGVRIMKRMEKLGRITGFVLVALIFCVLSACKAKSTQSQPVQSGAEKQYKFAYAVKNLTNPQFIGISDAVKETAQKYGATVNIQATESETQIDKQIQMLQTFLTQGYDAIFVSPLSTTAIVPFVKECNDAGVPIICIDTLADPEGLAKIGAKVDASVVADNITAGKLAAQTVIDFLNGNGTIAILEGTPGASSAIQNLEGIHEVLASAPGIKIAASQTAEWNRNKGYEVALSILAANPNLDFILSCNDEMALGAVQAIRDSGFSTDNIPVLGINGVPNARAAVKAGDMYATIDKSAWGQGSHAVENAMTLLRGGQVPEIEYIQPILLRKGDLE